MTLLRSASLVTVFLAACGGGPAPSTLPAEPPPAPAADEAATPVEPEPAAAPAMAAEPPVATPAAAPTAPIEEAKPTAPARKTRAPVKKAADPCAGGE
jgi:hypothetical protein